MGDIITVGTVDQVNDYLVEHPEERDAIMAEEQAGRARKGILEGPHSDAPADLPEPEEAGEPLEAAKAQGFDGYRPDDTPLDAYTLQGVNASNLAAEADRAAANDLNGA